MLQTSLQERKLLLMKFAPILIRMLLSTVPRDYREDAKYCFYDLTEPDKQTLHEAFQYLIGGIEYRINSCFDCVNQRILLNWK